MSPTIFRARGFRFFFYLREEKRAHVHVHHADGEAKFWLEPRIELARNHGLDAGHLRIARELIREHEDEIRESWARLLGG